MVTYPVRINVKPYTGKDPAKRRKHQAKLEDAAKIERYLNEQMANRSVRTFHYFDIAQDLGLHEKTVRVILFPVDGGYNGITVSNPQIKDCDGPQA